jgi:hypothetical protein
LVQYEFAKSAAFRLQKTYPSATASVHQLLGCLYLGYYTDYKQAMDDDDLMWLPTDACLHEDPEFKKYFYKYAGDQAGAWLPSRFGF